MLVILQQENDIYKGLDYGFGLKNASVAVIEYVNSTIILSGSKIQNKTTIIHFIFLMLASKCGGAAILVRVKLFQNYGFGWVKFSCEVRKVLPYNKTDKGVQQGNRL